MRGRRVGIATIHKDAFQVAVVYSLLFLTLLGIKGSCPVLSLCAEDLKKLIERPDLECGAGMAVCTSVEAFVEDALDALLRAMGPAGSRRLRVLYFLVIPGGPLLEMLPLILIEEAAGAVSAHLPHEGDCMTAGCWPNSVSVPGKYYPCT